jgi:hypothetical protein
MLPDRNSLESDDVLSTAGEQPGDFQPGGTSWSLHRDDICDLLERSSEVQYRNIYYGSNACYLIQLRDDVAGCSYAVYKPARGEYPLWDFPHGSLHRREVATYRLDRLLGWQLVPPAIVAQGKYGVGSLQLFVEESEEQAVSVHSLRRMELFDWVINNADRKPDHLLVAPGGHLWGIDHGLTFHAQPKLRTILWHFAGERMSHDEVSDLRRVRSALEAPEGGPVKELLQRVEFRALLQRIDGLIGGGVFPNPQFKSVPYRW